MYLTRKTPLMMYLTYNLYNESNKKDHFVAKVLIEETSIQIIFF